MMLLLRSRCLSKCLLGIRDRVGECERNENPRMESVALVSVTKAETYINVYSVTSFLANERERGEKNSRGERNLQDISTNRGYAINVHKI